MALPKQRGMKWVEDHIEDVSDAEPHLKVLVYGRNGHGKTRFACTAPRPLLLDMNERGTRSVRKYPGVKVIKIKRWAEISYVYWYLKEGNHPYESVILDTLTGMQGICIKQILKEGEDRDPSKDPKTMSQREWGKLAELMKEQVLNYRNLPLHCIFTAQERVVDDPETESRERVPNLSPGSRGPACDGVEIIGRIYKREVRVAGTKGKETKTWETRLLVGPHEEYTTKDRTGALGRIVREPTVPMMLKAANLTEDE